MKKQFLFFIIMLTGIVVSAQSGFTITAPDDISTVIPFGAHTLIIPTIGMATYSGFGIGIHIENNAPATYLPDTTYVTWTATDTNGITKTDIQKIYVHYPPCGGSVVATDYEATTYESVLIGAYCWTKSNLRSTKYSDGSAIPVALIYKSDLHEDTAANLTEYGRLYSWYSAVNIPENSSISPDTDSNGNVQGVCPDGWYLPGEKEYQEAFLYGSDALKSSSGWLNERNGSNTTGFTSFPGGMYSSSTSSFIYLLGNAYYWTSDRKSGNSICTSLLHNCPDFLFNTTSKSNGYSVRCIKENVKPTIGNILCTDGTIAKLSDWPIAGKTAQGIVFYVDSTNIHGWAIALQDESTSLTWGAYGMNIVTLTNYTTAETAKTDMDGYGNTQRIRAAGNAVTYPAAWTVDFANGWYLPAAGQLFKLIEVSSSINSVLHILDAPQLGDLWSSSELSATYAWGVYGSDYLYTYTKYTSLRVRAVRNF